MRWETRITELLDCEYPIIQGALSRIGNWKFAAAVSNAGGYIGQWGDSTGSVTVSGAGSIWTNSGDLYVG
ncbi:MAG: hypothetical protein QGF81_05040, partial [Dehalococcoidia bacterium]|nr:hypothetical protein [Dehalococcoidia bacterium]